MLGDNILVRGNNISVEKNVYNKIQARFKSNRRSTVTKIKISGNTKSHELIEWQIVGEIY